MPEFDIPVIISVKAENIDEARKAVYKSMEAWNAALIMPGQMTMANDSATYKRQRLVILHPEDRDSSYTQDEEDNDDTDD